MAGVMRTASLSVAIVTLAAIGLAGQFEWRAQQYAITSNAIYLAEVLPPGVTVSAPDPTVMADGRRRLADLVEATIFDVIAKSDFTAAQVSEALRELQGDLGLSKMYPRRSNVPFADLAAVQGARSLVVAFGILSGGPVVPNVDAHIRFYAGVANQWSYHGDVGASFGKRAFSIVRIRSGLPTEVWYVVSGAVLGATGQHLKVTVYGFDGLNVREVWDIDRLEGGSVRVGEDSLTVNYLDSSLGPFIIPREVTEIYYITSAGLIRR